MRVKCAVSDGKHEYMQVLPTTTIFSIKYIFSVILSVSMDSLTVLHSGQILDEATLIGSLDFSKRDFILIYVKKRTRPKLVPGVCSSRAVGRLNTLIALLRDMFRDVSVPIRDYFLRHPASLPQLFSSISRAYPGNASLFAENPNLLLGIFGIDARDFVDAINRADSVSRTVPDPINDMTDAEMIDRFMAELTPDDIRALERVMRTNVSLDVAIPIFIRQHKNVDATIEQINRMFQST
jgi:hypothetical protein